MVRKVPFAVALVLLAVSTAHAHPINSLFLPIYFGEMSLGKGARAWGMGGTQIALPGDPDATSWNPAALGQLARPSVTFSFAHENLRLRSQTTAISAVGSSSPIGTRTELNSAVLGAPIERLSFAYPFRLAGRPVAAQIAYERRVPYSLNTTYAFQYRVVRGAPTFLGYDYTYRYDAAGSGGIDVLSVSVAAEVTAGFRLGLTLNRWIRGFSVPVHETYDYTSTGGVAWTQELSDRLRFDLSGFSVDLGVQYAFGDRFFWGMVCKTGVNADLTYSNSAAFTNTFPYQRENLSGAHTGRGMLSLPVAFGMGVGVRPMADLLVAFDYVGTFWADGRIDDYARAMSTGDVPVAGTYLFPTMTRPVGWQQANTDRYHVGFEYVLKFRSVNLPVRAGLYKENLLAFDDGGKMQMAHGATTGVGFRWRRAGVDFAWVRHGGSDRFVRDSLRTSFRYGF